MRCKLVGELTITDVEKKLLDELETILADPAVLSAICMHLHLFVPKIVPAFFEAEGHEATISTGLLNESGTAISEPILSNLEKVEKGDKMEFVDSGVILLGLHRNNTFIRHLVESSDPHRVYYALSFLSNELTRCQKLLVPFSPYFQKVKRRLVSDMRHALMQRLMPSEPIPESSGVF